MSSSDTTNETQIAMTRAPAEARARPKQDSNFTSQLPCKREKHDLRLLLILILLRTSSKRRPRSRSSIWKDQTNAGRGKDSFQHAAEKWNPNKSRVQRRPMTRQSRATPTNPPTTIVRGAPRATSMNRGSEPPSFLGAIVCEMCHDLIGSRTCS